IIPVPVDRVVRSGRGWPLGWLAFTTQGWTGVVGAPGLAVLRRVKSAHRRPVRGTTRRNTAAPLLVRQGFAGLGLACGVGVGRLGRLAFGFGFGNRGRLAFGFGVERGSLACGVDGEAGGL